MHPLKEVVEGIGDTRFKVDADTKINRLNDEEINIKLRISKI